MSCGKEPCRGAAALPWGLLLSSGFALGRKAGFMASHNKALWLPYQHINGEDGTGNLGCWAEARAGAPSSRRYCGQTRKRLVRGNGMKALKNGIKALKKDAGNSHMDIRFIGKPHEWDPRRVYSQTGADWQQRVDFDRLRKDRLQRIKEQMNSRDLGALVLFAGANIRYVTASYQGNWKYNINIRYAVVPQSGEPVLFETAGSDLHCAEIDLPWMEDRIKPAITWQWAEGAVPFMAGRMAGSVVDVLKEHGVGKERIVIDNFDMPALEAFQKAGLKMVNGW